MKNRKPIVVGSQDFADATIKVTKKAATLTGIVSGLTFAAPFFKGIGNRWRT